MPADRIKDAVRRPKVATNGLEAMTPTMAWAYPVREDLKCVELGDDAARDSSHRAERAAGSGPTLPMRI